MGHGGQELGDVRHKCRGIQPPQVADRGDDCEARLQAKCGARPPGVRSCPSETVGSMRGGQEAAHAAREPHTDKTGPLWNVGRDRRASGRGLPKTVSSVRGGQETAGAARRPLTCTIEPCFSLMWGATAGRAVVPLRCYPQVLWREASRYDDLCLGKRVSWVVTW
jgi:hypothetical protein